MEKEKQSLNQGHKADLVPVRQYSINLQRLILSLHPKELCHDHIHSHVQNPVHGQDPVHKIKIGAILAWLWNVVWPARSLFLILVFGKACLFDFGKKWSCSPSKQDKGLKYLKFSETCTGISEQEKIFFFGG